MELELELYVEKFQVAERRDGCIYRTRSLGHEWLAEATIKDNRTAETNIIYAAASDEFARSHMTVRLKKG